MLKQSGGAGDGLECSIVVIARPRDNESWYASLEVPGALLGLDAGARFAILDAVRDTLVELRRLNLETRRAPGASRVPRLVFHCGVWARPVGSGSWNSSVTFNWPSCWSHFSRDAREMVMAALEKAFIEARDRLGESGSP